MIELARVIGGEIANPYPPAREWLVQEVLLAAIGAGTAPGDSRPRTT